MMADYLNDNTTAEMEKTLLERIGLGNQTRDSLVRWARQHGFTRPDVTTGLRKLRRDGLVETWERHDNDTLAKPEHQRPVCFRLTSDGIAEARRAVAGA